MSGHQSGAAPLSEEERGEVALVLARIEEVLETLTVRGLRVAGARELETLDALEEELRTLGATHLAERIADLSEGIRADDPSAGGTLMRTAVATRVFERVLSLEACQGPLATWALALEDEGA